MGFATSMRIMLQDGVSPAFKSMTVAVNNFGRAQNAVFRSGRRDFNNMMSTAKGFVMGNIVSQGISRVTGAMSGMNEEFIQFDDASRFAASKFKEVQDGTLSFNSALLTTQTTARSVGMATRFTAAEVAQAMDKMAMSGETLQNTNTETMMNFAKFATIAQTDLPQSVHMFTGAMKAWDVGFDKMSVLGDQMVNTFTGAKMSLEDLAASTEKSAGMYRSAGQRIETYNSILQVLAERNITAEEGGIKARNAMQALVRPQTLKGLRAMNISLSGTDGQWRNMIDIMSDLRVKLRDMYGEGLNPRKMAAMRNLFNLRDIEAVGVILDSTTGKIQDLFKRQENAGGAMEKQYQRVSSSVLDLQLKLRSALTEKFISAGVTVGPMLVSSLKEITAWATNIDMSRINEFLLENVPKGIAFLKDGFTTAKPYVQTTAGILAGMITLILDNQHVVLPMVQGFVNLKIAIAAAGVAQGVLNGLMMSNPIGLVIGLLGGLAVGLGVVWQNWERWGVAITETWAKIKSFTSMFGALFIQFNVLFEYFVRLRNQWDDVKASFTEKGVLAGLMHIGKIWWSSIFSHFTAGFDSFKKLAGNVLTWLRESIGNWIAGIVDFISAPFDALFMMLNKAGVLTDKFYSGYRSSRAESVALLRGSESAMDSASLLRSQGATGGAGISDSAVFDRSLLPQNYGLPSVVRDSRNQLDVNMNLRGATDVVDSVSFSGSADVNAAMGLN